MFLEQKTQIPYSSSYQTGKEISYIREVLDTGLISGNHKFTKLCHDFFNSHFGFESCFLTNSCSQALEMAAQLCNLSDEDEVIIPSFSYVTDASSFVKTGAKVVFADSCKNSPHVDPSAILKLLTKKTKVLVIVHYAGIPCDMDSILEIVRDHDLLLVEDCAQAIDVNFKGKPLGSFGDFSTFSFHETKNIHCGEGGLLVVNNDEYQTSAKQIWQEGTDKHLFENGEKSEYQWTHLGSSYQPSELSAAFLYAQLCEMDFISARRKETYLNYFRLQELENKYSVVLPNSKNKDFNGHIFYLGLPSKKLRDSLISFLKKHGIQSAFHYLPLHKSQFWLKEHSDVTLNNAEYWSECIIRLPIYLELSPKDQQYIIDLIFRFFEVQTKDTI